MDLHDCLKCWETPCMCGYDYKDWSKERLIELRDLLQELIDGTHKHSIEREK